MQASSGRLETLAEQRMGEAELDYLPSVVRDALKRAGAHATCARVVLQCNENARTPVYVSPDVHRRAAGQTMRGEYYCYMATHPIADRKKNTYIGVSKDPVSDVFFHNHAAVLAPVPPNGRAPMRQPGAVSGATRETHSSAPYWALSDVIGPFLTRAEGTHVRQTWHERTRGDESKRRKAHAIAQARDLTYFGHDVPSTREAVRTYVGVALGTSAGRIFDRMCTALDRLTASPASDSTQDEDDLADDDDDCGDAAAGTDVGIRTPHAHTTSLIHIPNCLVPGRGIDVTRPLISFVRPVH